MAWSHPIAVRCLLIDQAIGWLVAILSLREPLYLIYTINGNIYVLRIHIYTIYAVHIYAVGAAHNKKGMAHAIPKYFFQRVKG